MENVSMQEFATRLKALRQDNHLSQQELANATGLTQVAIAYWETEQRIPNAKAVIILARYFNVSTDYLLGEEDY